MKKTDISIILINLIYLRLELLKKLRNNKKVICDIFHHNFKNMHCYVTNGCRCIIGKRFYLYMK